jgi:metal-responsive CopG/Arc/MetJ family transcriptional regulator
MALSDHRTQIYLPEDLYKRAKRRAQEESVSLSAVIRKALERYLVIQEDWETDSISQLVGLVKDSGPSDLSVQVDEVLYGVKKKRKRR